MNHLTRIFLALFLICAPAQLLAQDSDDSKYLAGAVPEVDGRVVFTREFSIPGMSQEEIYDRMYRWMDERLKKNENNSRIAYTEEAEGMVAGVASEWLVFTSNAISLDRAVINYQIIVNCTSEKCVLEVGKIRYVYRDGTQKYTAEGWITDDNALNKAQTKLIFKVSKWRKKTIDFVDALAGEIAEALSVIEQPKETQASEEANAGNSGTILVTPKKQVTVQAPAQAPSVETAVVEAPQAPAIEETPAPAAVTSEETVQDAVAAVEETPAPAAATSEEAVQAAVEETPAPASAPSGYKAVAPEAIPADAILATKGRLVITAGEAAITADSGCALGYVDGKPAVFTILAPGQPYGLMEQAESYTASFYPNGRGDASIILECKRLPSTSVTQGMPRTYMGEITSAAVKEQP